MTFTKTMLILLVFFTRLEPAALAGEFFQWLDENGTPHFTNIPSKIPPDYRDQAEVRSIPDLPRVKPLAPLVSIKPSLKIDMDGHDERWWRERVRVWQSLKEVLTLNLAAKEKQLGRLQFENKTVFFKQTETRRLLQDMGRIKQEIQKTEEALQTKLPEEARRAGAPPGWLR